MSRKRKSIAELEARGTLTTHPELAKGRVTDRQSADPPPVPVPRPRWLKGLSATIWDAVAPALTKTGVLRPGLVVEELATWCCLQAQFRKDPTAMQSSRMALKRTYEVRLGMTEDAYWAAQAEERKTAKKAEDPAEAYFSDDDDPKPN